MRLGLARLVCIRPREILYGSTRLRHIRHKRRWRCAERGCCRGGVAVAGQQRCVSEIAVHCGATDMLTKVRQGVIGQTRGGRGGQTDPAWASRRWLLTT